ncbi:MAG: hypothetical protein JWM86_1031 [Thermoleophilia bacterium]|nr:hypothetical protein [Thermoleophilia bacterium]
MAHLARIRVAALAGALALALFAGVWRDGAHAASSATVVAATVPSATSIDVTGCPANTPGVTQLGSMLPGSVVATTVDCTVSFGSSNQTASLRMSEFDGGGRAMHRVNSGAPDPTFGGSGSLRTDLSIGGSVDSLNVVTRQSDGKLLLGGLATGTSGIFTVARLTTTGALDPTWGTGGYSRFSFGLSGTVGDVEVLPDGKVLVVGSTTDTSGSTRMFVRRLTSSGGTDLTYGSAGTTILPRMGTSESGDSAVEAQLQSSGKLVIAGSVTTTSIDFAIARLDANGGLDTTFGSGGSVVTDIRTNDRVYGMLVQADDRIVVVGYSEGGAPTGNDMALARYGVNGAPDATFGSGGTTLVSIATSTDLGYDVLQQPDGKLVVGGSTFVGSSFHLVAVRLGIAGGLDTTFNGTGWSSVGILGGTETDYGMAIGRQSDGSLVLTGSYRDGAWNGSTTTGQHMATVRFTSGGVLDTTWGISGKRLQTVGSTDGPWDLIVQPDDAVVVVGSSVGASQDLLAVRYTAAGALDGTFATGGTFFENVGSGGTDIAQGGIVLRDGRLLSVGRAAGGFGVATAMLASSTGVPDSGWNGTGSITTSSQFGFQSMFWAAAQQADGKVVLAGTAYDGTRNVMWVQRRLLDGSLDSSFGTGGNASVAPGTASAEAFDVDVQADGRIVLVGYTPVAGVNRVAVARLTSTGAADTTFAGTGSTTFAIGTVDDIGYGLALQRDGKVVVAGYSSNGANFDLAVARLTQFGDLDQSFGTGGRTTSNLNGANDVGRQVELQDDGRIVVSGYTTQAGTIQAVAARYTTTGILDASFGSSSGHTRVTISGHPTVYARTLALGAGGSITLAGQANDGGMDKFFATRLTKDGAPDTSFNAGTPIAYPALGPGYARQVALGRDGQVVLFGSSSLSGDAAAVTLSLRNEGSIADYATGVTDFATGASAFGACLRATSGSTPTAGWPVDPAGTCAASDAAPWRAIPDVATSIATTPSIGGMGATASFRFGARAASNQPPGDYEAPLRFEVLAPGA